MLYHPALEKAYHVYQTVIFSLSTILFFPAIYIILTQSTTQMGAYRLLLVNTMAEPSKWRLVCVPLC